ncbi:MULTISPECIES: imelysin family protein [unclassified Vibrio]|uniref:Imelysin family protein n=1 Tax=Vibrio sp. HB236076 TaxID=3232307 RepID=A0AB39HBJ3_9VIBR|nr:imelysin family protein [Vibrio sp. HB161653]MDP5253519.1 imelysin family protein [Vibrio sp. HB161653]
MNLSNKVALTLIGSLGVASANLQAAEVTQQQVVEQYTKVAHAVFADSYLTAQALQEKIDQFVTSPSEATLEAAKQAWLAARVPYQQSEVFRFGNAIVDDWEGQLNAWPLDEGLIDYVADDYQYELGNAGAKANIIANTSINVGNTTLDTQTISSELIASLNELGGSEANVASGYHAIEFLLWGQDLNGTNAGAGERPYTDYVQGEGCTHGHCERRAQYLQSVTQLLVDDLAWMEKQWATGNKENYRQLLLSESAENGLRKMLFGMGSLSLGELAGERMKVALEAHSTEDEHDCFSDNTHNSHYYNEQGVYNVFTGSYKRVNGELVTGPSLYDLVKQQDAQAAARIQQQFDTTRAQVHTLVESAQNNQYFDQLIAPGNEQGNALVNQSINALVAQTAAIEDVSAIIGIDNLNPDTADHEF